MAYTSNRINVATAAWWAQEHATTVVSWEWYAGAFTWVLYRNGSVVGTFETKADARDHAFEAGWLGR